MLGFGKNERIDRPEGGRGSLSRRTVLPVVTGFIALVALAAAVVPWNRTLLGADRPGIDVDLERIEARLSFLEDGLTHVTDMYERDVQPVEQVLRYYSANDTLVRRIAVALVREGRSVDVDPRILTSLLLVENPWLDPEARSGVGAIGLMQVMPFHAGSWGCEGSDLTDVDVNICHGAKVFEHALTRSKGNLDRALLRYNGCVRGTNTPDCHLYPSKVYAAAGKALAQEWISGEPS